MKNWDDKLIKLKITNMSTETMFKNTISGIPHGLRLCIRANGRLSKYQDADDISVHHQL